MPIIQGGMGVCISMSGLAAAVAAAGCIGVIAATGIGMFESDLDSNYKQANQRALAREIRRARSLTDGIIGVNIMVALQDFFELVETAVAEKADVVFLGAGLPLGLPPSLPLDRLDDLETRFAPIVSSGKAAKLIFRYWAKHYRHVPDAVVVEGPLAGGHLGFRREQLDDPAYQLESLLAETLAAVKPYEARFGKEIPVVAAGGIYTGADIHRFLELGAAGVQMATRFVATRESDASDEFKQAYLDCRPEDLLIVDSPVGLPGRAISNRFLKDAIAGQRHDFPCPWKCLKTCERQSAPYCIGRALYNAKTGNLAEGFAFAGANAHRVDRIVSVQELVDTLLAEYAAARAAETPARPGRSAAPAAGR